MNQRISAIVHDIIMHQVEQTPEAMEWSAQHERALEAIYALKQDSLVDDEVVDIIENISLQYGRICGEMFFEWGLKIGRDPSIALELPDIETHSVV